MGFSFSLYLQLLTRSTIGVVQLQKGANDGRSDDIRRVKSEEVTIWVNQTFSPSAPLNPKNRDHRGFQNDFTGRLLCPIEYSWDDLEYVITIGLFHFLITLFDDSCVVSVQGSAMVNWTYPKTISLRVFIRWDTEIQTMLKNIFFEVVFSLRFFFVLGFWIQFADYSQTFCAIFTSPSSSEAFEDQESYDGPTRKKQKTASQKKATKSTVASLLHMEGRVTPRAIAYAATLVMSSII